MIVLQPQKSLCFALYTQPTSACKVIQQWTDINRQLHTTATSVHKEIIASTY